MDQLQEQATSRQAELAQKMEKHSVAMKEKEKEVLDLQIALIDAKERILREAERIANEKWNYSLKPRRFGGNARNSKKWPMNSC